MTLIEVLVVIGIMVILATMVVPIFSTLQSRQQVSVCANNLRMIGQALLMYRADHMGFPPDAGEWWVAPNPPQPGTHGLGLAQLYYAFWAYEQAGPLDYVIPPANYLTGARALHCPRAPADRPDFGDWPYLGGYNVYDWNYRRDRSSVWPEQGLRNLKQPFPPDNTVVTWCPMHRAIPPADPTDLGDLRRNDQDLVLWADGSVSRMPSRYDQYKAEQPR
jgi:type II secretory pathway pseudopilin PulG